MHIKKILSSFDSCIDNIDYYSAILIHYYDSYSYLYTLSWQNRNFIPAKCKHHQQQISSHQHTFLPNAPTERHVPRSTTYEASRQERALWLTMSPEAVCTCANTTCADRARNMQHPTLAFALSRGGLEAWRNSRPSRLINVPTRLLASFNHSSTPLIACAQSFPSEKTDKKILRRRYFF